LWRDPATPTLAQAADAAVKLHAEGILPTEAVWEDLGYSPARQAKLRSSSRTSGRTRSWRRCCRCRRTRRLVRRRSRRRCRLGRLVPLPLAAERHYAYQQNVASAAVRGAQLAWSKVSLRDLDGSWRAVSGGLLALVTAAQVAAARDADPYLSAVLAEQGQSDDPAGQVQPSAFAGIAADGRGLASLLESALVTVKVSLTAGTMTPDRALASGGSSLEMLTQTTVQDAGRDSVCGRNGRPPGSKRVHAHPYPALMLAVRDPRRSGL
jgi:hypothetical protein